MSESTPATGFKPKKSVALSGTAAGNTALCTVGRSGNDLHYRGYDILDIATTSEFEEVAYLLVHGKLPNRAELAGYKARLKALRGVPAAVKAAVKVPILANLTEFGSTPFFTVDELRGADVDIALYCCGAYRAMNKAALNFYETVRREGTQKNIIDTLQTRAELYDYLGYHAYEDKLDALFAKKGEA